MLSDDFVTRCDFEIPLILAKFSFSCNMPAVYNDKLIGGKQLSRSPRADADISNAQSPRPG